MFLSTLILNQKFLQKYKNKSKSKPSLRETMITSHKAVEKFVKNLERQANVEESTKKALEKVSGKYQELLSSAPMLHWPPLGSPSMSSEKAKFASAEGLVSAQQAQAGPMV